MSFNLNVNGTNMADHILGIPRLELRFSYSSNLATCFPRPLIFQTINSGRSSSLSLKYQRFTPSGCKDIGVRKYKFVAKTQFLRLELKKKLEKGWGFRSRMVLFLC